MDTIHLKPKYQKIEKELIKNNENPLKRDNMTNSFIKLNAHMIAQGLQLAEEISDSQEN